MKEFHGNEKVVMQSQASQKDRKTPCGGRENVRKSSTAVVTKIWNISEKKNSKCLILWS